MQKPEIELKNLSRCHNFCTITFLLLPKFSLITNKPSDKRWSSGLHITLNILWASRFFRDFSSVIGLVMSLCSGHLLGEDFEQKIQIWIIKMYLIYYIIFELIVSFFETDLFKRVIVMTFTVRGVSCWLRLPLLSRCLEVTQVSSCLKPVLKGGERKAYRMGLTQELLYARMWPAIWGENARWIGKLTFYLLLMLLVCCWFSIKVENDNTCSICLVH